MLEIVSGRFGFTIKTIWFSEIPFDIAGVDGVVFHACPTNVDPDGFSKREFSTSIIDLTQDLEVIWNRMSRPHRKAIRRGEDKGIQIQVNQGFEEFLEINRRFRQEKGLPPNNLNADFLKKYGTLFTSVFDGATIGGKYILNDDRHMRGLLIASKRIESADDMRSLIGDASKLLIWKAIQYAKSIGIETYDLGGYYTGDTPDPQMEGINQFKRSFGGDIVTQYIYEKDYSPLLTYAKKAHKVIKTFQMPPAMD